MTTEAPTRPTAAPRGPRQRPRVPVFNPSDWPDDVQAGGRTYHFEPGGVTYIEDMLEWERDEETRALLYARPQKIAPDGNDADKIATLICSSDVRGDKGFVILDGAPDTWDAQKAEAREKWVAQHEGQVEATIASWEAECAGRVSAGLPLPTQKKAVVLAYAWRKRHRAGLTRDPELLCLVCSHYASTRDELAAHVREEHPRQAAQLLGTPAPTPVVVAPPPAAEPVSRGRGRQPAPHKVAQPAPAPQLEADDETPEESAEREAMEAQDFAPPDVETALGNLAAQKPGKADQVIAGNELVARAEKVGMALSVADRKGLKHGDSDVIEDVLARITAHVDRVDRKARAETK